MNERSNIDLLNLVLLQRSSIDLQFQFWLSITFAVVVASFTAGPRLIFQLRLYGLNAAYSIIIFLILASLTIFNALVTKSFKEVDR